MELSGAVICSESGGVHTPFTAYSMFRTTVAQNLLQEQTVAWAANVI